jgi:hypothetical protein
MRELRALTSESGPLRHFAATQPFGRYRINNGQTALSGLTGSAAFDPKQLTDAQVCCDAQRGPRPTTFKDGSNTHLASDAWVR